MSDIELMLVTVTAGLIDVISTLVIISSLRNTDVKRTLRADETLNENNLTFKKKSRNDCFIYSVNLQIIGGVLK